ncbi:2-isopropylmalate synthase [Clostridia bacterium]|nr:2-isopropylmalate synthase [Clostridia bacterium]
MISNNGRQIVFFDTTLRDGEQTPGVALNLGEKIEIARHLEKLGVNVIEAGFTASSPGDYEAVRAVAKTVTHCGVASLARCVKSDIEASAKALEGAKFPRIHVFIATSDVHMKYKLRMDPDTVYKNAVEMTAYAKTFCDDIEFSAEDASRSDRDFLVRIVEGVIDAGATTVNIPDTVGYSTPREFFDLIDYINTHVKNIHRAKISVHCHNDLGLAASNSLAAIEAGATQIECTVNGLGERGGNAALEEIVMGLATRADYYGVTHTIVTTEITGASKSVAALTGIAVCPTKPIVGANAFLHSSGIHQHGVLANKSTYEIMTPESVGLTGHNNIVLGKLSGRHAFVQKLAELGITLDDNSISSAFDTFKKTADRKKTITDDDLFAIANEFIGSGSGKFALENFQITTTGTTSTATITLKVSDEDESFIVTEAAVGAGPIDSAFNAINRIAGNNDMSLESYGINAATEGADALGIASVKLRFLDVIYKGTGTSTDIFEASIKAYINALNAVQLTTNS